MPILFLRNHHKGTRLYLFPPSFRFHKLCLEAQVWTLLFTYSFWWLQAFLDDGLQCRREYNMNEASKMKGRSWWTQCLMSFQKWRQESTEEAGLRHISNGSQGLWTFSLFHKGLLKWLDNYMMVRCHSEATVLLFYRHFTPYISHLKLDYVILCGYFAGKYACAPYVCPVCT